MLTRRFNNTSAHLKDPLLSLIRPLSWLSKLVQFIYSLFSFLFKSYKAFISNFRCDKCAQNGIVDYNGFWNWCSYTHQENMHFTFRKFSTFFYFLRQKKNSFFVFFRSDFLSFLLDSIMF